MVSRTRRRHRIRWTRRSLPSRSQCVLLVFALLAPLSLLADGCFVFKWNKNIDINEPTQKAVIVYDAGHEDLLLQVKYEGPLEEFGWLIPVPSLPKVEKGSMEPFYELSQLTQRQFGKTKGFNTLSAVPADSRGEEKVKVIEIKTVGAYEVAILTAKDANSLKGWLEANDYSLPEGKSDIFDDYIRRGWFFIAAKIDLRKSVGFKAVSGGSPKNSEISARQAIKSKLSSGELHPLLISFDTPECIFPLKISAVGGKPSEVSLYVLSTEPLLNPFIFDKASEKLKASYASWESQKPQNNKARLASIRNMQALRLSFQMYAMDRTNRAKPGWKPSWKQEDLEAIAAERVPTEIEPLDDDRFYASPEELLQCLKVTPDKIPKSAKGLPRLKGRTWHLTKQVWTFAPSEMNDLKFVPAIPTLARFLAQPVGSVAAQILAGFGSNAIPNLVAACRSTRSIERVNAVRALEQLRDQELTDPLAELLHDETPQVRLHAIRASEANWGARFTDPVMSLMRDPYPEIRQEATACLSSRESPSRTPAYLALLTDDDPNVRAEALGIAWSLNRRKPPPEVQNAALRLLRDPNEDVQNYALHMLWRMDHNAIPRADLMPLLNSSQAQTVVIAVRLIEGTGLVRPALAEPEASAREAELRTRRLSSPELAVLATNRLGEIRFMSLQLLERNGDAEAVELILPQLRDANSVISSRAFTAMRNISGKDISESDASKWDQWWAANKATVKPKP